MATAPARLIDHTALTLDDFVNDVMTVTRAVAADQRFSGVCLIGHSEGAGLVLPAGDEASLTAALVDLLRSAALRERTSYAGRARVLSTYSSDRVGQRWQDLYRGLAGLP